MLTDFVVILTDFTIIDPRYEWSIYSGWGWVLDFKLLPSQLLIGRKSASDWLEKNLRAVGYSRIHVTNFKTLSLTKALQKLASSSTKALQKLCIKLY
jgi:hypothetical protein